MRKTFTRDPIGLAGQLHSPVALAVATLAMLGGGPVLAQDAPATPDEIRRDLATPDSRLNLTLLGINADNRRFGANRGLAQAGVHGIVDIDVVQRDDATGTWFRFYGHDLGLSTGEFRLVSERQGQWAVSVAGSQFVRREPLRVVTGLAGEGTAQQVISGTAAQRELTLQQDREVVDVALRRIFDAHWDLRLSLRQDRREGERLFGRGTPNVIEFLTEPIDTVTTSWGGQLGFLDKRFQFQGGYSGTHHENRIPVIFSSGGNTGSFGTLWAIAQPPSNTAHQLWISGGVNLMPGARTSFKLSRTVAEQNEPFDPSFVRLAGAPASLNGRLVTSLGYVDLSFKPVPIADVVASVRFEDRDDQTPIARYLAAQTPSTGNFATAGVTGFNKPRSLTQMTTSLEAGFRLAPGYRLIAGGTHETLDRDVSDTYRRMGFRAHTREESARIELRRSMSETLNGGVALLHQRRGGSEYVPDTYDPAALSNRLASLMWADREREKLRLTADWSPDEKLSVQFLGETAADTYSGRQFGPREGRYRFASVDAAFSFHPQWSLNGWVTRSMNQAVQITRTDRVGAVASGFDTIWSADIRHEARAAGVVLKGYVNPRLQVGADLSATRETVRHDFARVGGTGTAALPVLPGMAYRQALAKLFGDLALRKDTAVRVDLGLERRSNSDWTWLNWVYNGSTAVAAAARRSDGTTVTNLPSESVAFVAVTLRYRWR